MKLARTYWDFVKIGDVTTELKAGFSSGKFELNDGDIAHFRPMNINNDCKITWEGTKYISSEIFENNDKLQLNKGDVLFNNTNSTELVGKSCYVDKDYKCGFSNHMTRIRVNKDLLDSYYLSIIFFAYFKNRTFESYCQKWVGQSGINRSILSEIEIPLPPLEEQKQIISLFKSIESSIEQVEEQENNLTTLKKQLLRDIFGSSYHFGNFLTKPDYEPVKFNVLASNISERVEPKETDLNTYVGLEHLDSESLTIERTGKPDDVIGTKLKIYNGDIIFGKRRAYLRKIAVSHFDGIASAHSMILRANENNIEKDFLPFFMQSDVFMERAVQISEGSLSPTIKWKTLAAQEFLIPKKVKQHRLAEIFKHFDQTTQELKQQKSTLMSLKYKLLNEILA